MNIERGNITRPENKWLVMVLAMSAIVMLAGSLFSVTGIQLKPVSSEGQASPECRLIAGIAFGGDAGGSMTKNGQSGSGKTVILTIPAIVSGGSHHVDPRPVTPVIELKTCPKTNLHRSENFSTTACISPKKANEFTLVGARPSGTS
jgi:hypothetical protein